MLEISQRLLIGPLYNPAVIGAYARDPNIRLFMPASDHSRDYAYDLVYPHGLSHFNELFDYLPAGWEPELVIWWDPVYQAIPPGIEDCPYPTAMIPGDWNLAFGTVLQVAKCVDGVFADARLGPILQKAGIANVHQWPGFAYDASQVHAEAGLERIHDICFIGNMNPSIHPRRSRYLAQVLSLQDRYRLFLRHGVWGADYRRALNQSRIVLNYTICQVMNMRAYEAPACGALLFIEEDNREVRDVFRDRESCVLYNDDNLIELLRYYLEHEDERAAIAAKGQQIVQNYNYEKHFERLLVQVPALLANRPAQRPVLGPLAQTPQERYLNALNQIVASNRHGAESAAGRLNALWEDFSRGLRREQLWELNALLVLLFPHLDEHQQLKQVYGVALRDLLQGFETGLLLATNNPVLRYHHGLACEFAGDETQALWSYSRSIELMAAGHSQELIDYRDFILPFNKSGRGTDQLAFEWERISYESIEQDESAAGAYSHLLVSSIWQRIGRILNRQGRLDKALIAFQNAHQNFPRATLMLEIAKLQLRLPDQGAEQAFASCLEMLKLQPLMIGALPELLTPELLLRHAGWVHAQTGLYLSLFPELGRLHQLAALALAAAADVAPDWRDLLEIPFSTDFYQWLCLLLQRLEAAPALKPLQALRQLWSLNWKLPLEAAPGLEPGCGLHWSENAPELGERPDQPFQRLYDSPSDLRKGRLGTDAFPLLFPPQAGPSALIDELTTGCETVFLAIPLQWTQGELRELLRAFEAGWADQPQTLLLIWAPAGSGLSLADLEACLPDNMQAQLAWLDEALSQQDQAALIAAADLLLASPRGQSLFYSYWARALHKAVAWIHSPDWLPDQGAGGFGLPVHKGPAEALTQPDRQTPPDLPLHWTDPERSRQAWLNGLWRLRLYQTFG